MNCLFLNISKFVSLTQSTIDIYLHDKKIKIRGIICKSTSAEHEKINYYAW